MTCNVKFVTWQLCGTSPPPIFQHILVFLHLTNQGCFVSVSELLSVSCPDTAGSYFQVQISKKPAAYHLLRWSKQADIAEEPMISLRSWLQQKTDIKETEYWTYIQQGDTNTTWNELSWCSITAACVNRLFMYQCCVDSLVHFCQMGKNMTI